MIKIKCHPKILNDKIICYTQIYLTQKEFLIELLVNNKYLQFKNTQKGAPDVKIWFYIKLPFGYYTFLWIHLKK